MLEQSPRSIQLSDVESAGLVLATDQAVSAELLRLAPGFRTKLFTIREGAGLAAGVRPEVKHNWQDDDPRCSPEVEKSDGRLEWLVAEMDARRGWVSIPERPQGLLGRQRRSLSRYDIADVHGESARQHRLMIDELSSTISTLANVMANLVEL